MANRRGDAFSSFVHRLSSCRPVQEIIHDTHQHHPETREVRPPPAAASHSPLTRRSWRRARPRRSGSSWRPRWRRRPASGRRWSPRSTQDAGTIRLRIDRSQTSRSATALGAEGYRLSVTPQQVTISAPKPAGLFYGVQSLRQLLPPAIFREASVVQGVEWTIPCVEIEDAPRFAWRGMMLDVCPALHAQGIRQEVHRPARAAQVQHPPLAPDRRSGLAHRDQALSPADRDRRVAEGDAGRQARMAQPQLRRGLRRQAARRLLHPGRYSRDRRLRGGALRQHRA